MTTKHAAEVLFEFTRIGNTIRATAIDAASGTEVTFQAPAATSTRDLQRAALNKLNYVLEKKNKPTG